MAFKESGIRWSSPALLSVTKSIYSTCLQAHDNQRIMKRILVATLLILPAFAIAQDRIPIIFDTDFVMPPHDDSMALMLALQSPELEILGVTTVMGNESLERATSDVLRMLEIAGQADIPVYEGADMPLVHAKSDFAVAEYGRWYENETPPEPPGGYAQKQAEQESAVSFIVRTVMERPGEVTIVAIGPLTNIAQAIRAEPGFAANVDRLVIMGGAVATLPDGAGNVTPNAEFNFWVDPEAAYVTLRSGIPIELSPLNVSRKVRSRQRLVRAYGRCRQSADRTPRRNAGSPLRVRPGPDLVHVRSDRRREPDRSDAWSRPSHFTSTSTSITASATGRPSAAPKSGRVRKVPCG